MYLERKEYKMEKIQSEKEKEMLKRWKIFNDLLHLKNGTTYKEYNERLLDEGIDSDEDLLRKDKEIVDELLVESDYPKIETVGGRSKRMFIPMQSIDICSLKKPRRPSFYYRELLDMLSHTKGLLTDEWLEKMNIHFDAPDEDWSNQGNVISFEQNMNLDDYTYMPDFFKAIRKKQVIKVEFKPFHLSSYVIIFHPEFLKQYRRLWYAFGLGKKEEDTGEFELTRIPLDRVVSEPIICKKMEFKSSGTDYIDYFDEIVGVDNYPGRNIDHIRIKVKRNMAERIDHNELCSGQRRDKELDDPNYLGYCFNVKINKELVRVLYSYGSDIKVIAPSHLVKLIKKELKKNIQLYDD